MKAKTISIVAYITIINIILTIVISVVPSLGSILVLAGLLPIVLLVFGVITAANEARKPIPIIGKIFEGMFNF